MRRTIALVSIAVMMVLAFAAPASSASHGPEVQRQLAEVRRATTKYHDLAAALADGYEPASPCVPGMGYHYANFDRVAPNGGALDATAPAILVYAPNPQGKLRLVAVEYAVAPDASQPYLFGRAFDDTRAYLGIWTLHAWVWQANPHGVFQAMNPNIRHCPVGV
jgi:hypothetical protein